MKVLIVSGDCLLAHVLKATLLYGGFEPECTSCEFEAYRLSIGVDCVLIDLSIANSSGAKLAKAITDACEVPVLVLTDHRGPEIRLLALEAGADDVVAKAFLPSELIARVRTLIKRRQRQEPPEPSEPAQPGAPVTLRQVA